MVAESVVVIKKLLQSKAAEHYEIITQMAKLIDYINVAAARAAIIWLIGEYNEKVPLIAPDVLRKMAKSFVDEQDVVKLQVLNLGVKLYLTNPEQTSLLCQYVFTLARYDTNYDVRDRARFLRQFIFPASGGSTVLSQHAREIFLAAKPAPVPESKYRDGNLYQLGSLSHYLNMQATGYKELPPFPAVAPDSSVRNIAGYTQEKLPGESPTRSKSSSQGAAKGAGDKGFLSESEKSSAYTGSSGGSSGSDSGSSGSDASSDSDSEPEQAATLPSKADRVQAQSKASVASGQLIDDINNVSSSSSNPIDPLAVAAAAAAAASSTGNNNNNNAIANSGTSDSGESSFYSGSSSDESGSDSASDNEQKQSQSQSQSQQQSQSKNASSADQKQAKPQLEPQSQSSAKTNLDLLLDLDDIPPIGPVMTPSLGGFLTPGEICSLSLSSCSATHILICRYSHAARPGCTAASAGK